MRDKVYAKLTAVFEDVFDDYDVKINDNTVAGDIEGWDSLTHITLISAIEEEFGIEFSMKEVLGLNNVGDLVNLIIEKSEA